MHPEIELGDECSVIELDFFEYDTSRFSKLMSIQEISKKRVLFIGAGYDIIGDCFDYYKSLEGRERNNKYE